MADVQLSVTSGQYIGVHSGFLQPHLLIQAPLPASSLISRTAPDRSFLEGIESGGDEVVDEKGALSALSCPSHVSDQVPSWAYAKFAHTVLNGQCPRTIRETILEWENHKELEENQNF